jgi:hypothetical protein
MASRPNQRSLAKRSVDIMSSAVNQLLDSMPSRGTPAYKFLQALAKRLDSVKIWLKQLRSGGEETQILVCLEAIYAVSLEVCISPW